MKIVQVVSFMHAVVGNESHTITIQASSVNRFCAEMHRNNIECALDMHEFRALASLYPHDMNITSSELRVEPTPRFKKALFEASQFDVNRPNDKEICEVWKSVVK